LGDFKLVSLYSTIEMMHGPINIRITGTLREKERTFLIISRTVLLRMRNVSDESCRENKIKKHILYSVTFFSENRAVHETWKNIEQPARP